MKLFQRALPYCDAKKLHLALLGILERAGHDDLASSLLQAMSRKFNTSAKVGGHPPTLALSLPPSPSPAFCPSLPPLAGRSSRLSRPLHRLPWSSLPLALVLPGGRESRLSRPLHRSPQLNLFPSPSLRRLPAPPLSHGTFVLCVLKQSWITHVL